MGLLDTLGMGGPEAKVRRLQKKAMQKFGPAENRQGAIEELGELKTEAAIDALLSRYTFRVDPGITDDDEKARVLALVTQEGLLPEAEVVKFLVEVATKIGGEYSRVPEKKVLLMHALSAHRSPDIAPAVLPFLDDMDDEVQIAAAEVIVKQQHPAGREPLIQHFLKAHEASNARVREALSGLLADSGWDVKGYTPKVEAALPQGYKLDSRGKVLRK